MTLQFLTLDQIKKHLRIDPEETMYDDELLVYGCSAENAALKYMERDLASLYEEYMKVPEDIIHACLCRVGASFKYREDITDRNLYRVPYTWDMLLLPYLPPDKL